MAESYESQKGIHRVMSPSKGGIVNLGNFIRSSDVGRTLDVVVTGTGADAEAGLNLTRAE